MKKLLIFASIFIAIGCQKNPNNPVTPSTPNNPVTNTYYWAHYIPNWYNGDTLLGYIADSNGIPTGVYDTIFTKSLNDTSYIIHKGKQFYIWTTSWLPTDTFKTNQQIYINVVINDRRDTVGALSWNLGNSVATHKFKDKAGNWEYQLQYLYLPGNNPKYDRFKAMGSYLSKNKKY